MPESIVDKCYQELTKLIDSPTSNLSESDTRAKLIDPLFRDCLAWSEDDIRRESHVHEGFLDYVFSTNGYPRFVEAKREGKAFVIPESLSQRHYKINGTISSDPTIKEAIEQAQKYCISFGVKYGIISNGHQYIIFEAFRSGADWREGKCVVFSSLTDIKENFTLFWNILSRESVGNGSLKRYISEEDLPEIFIVPRSRLHAKDSSLTRNYLSAALQPFLSHVFGDLIDQSPLEVLRSCYVTKKDYEDANLEIGRHFDRPPGFAKRYMAETAKFGSESETFQRLYERSEEFLRKSAYHGSLILLMGGIGAGKTTFIHHFFNFDVTSKGPSGAMWFYVDFTKAPADPTEIEKYIYSSLLRELGGKYATTFEELRQELAKVGAEYFKPDIKDLVVVFSKLALRGFTLSLVLDNADQHSYVSPEYQERVLLAARNLTDTLRTVTIVTLREESFFKSTMSGVLDAFLLPVFHVSSPNFEDLIRYRIKYILELLNLPDDQIRERMKSAVDFSEYKEDLKMFFEIINNSLRSSRPMGRDILEYMNEISGGDMRAALRFFRNFLVSGNTNVPEMMDIEKLSRSRSGPGYRIPLHHVVKSTILEHSRLYSESHSRIMNLFSLNPQHTNSHFLHLRILTYLHRRMTYETPHGRGFVEIDNILQEAEELSIKEAAIADSLKKMSAFGLVEFENQSKIGYETAVYVRMTNTGSYYLRRLVREFAYLDLMWMDTPISDLPVVDALLKLVVELRLLKSSNDIEERFLRTELFLSYLKDKEDHEFAESPELNDSILTRAKFMNEILESFKESREYIRARRGERLLKT